MKANAISVSDPLPDEREGSENTSLDPGTKLYHVQVPPTLMARHRELGLNLGDLLLWATLRRHAGFNGDCFPNEETLAKELGVSTDTVQRSLKRLVAAELVQIRRRRRESQGYHLLAHPLITADVQREKRGQQTATVRHQERLDTADARQEAANQAGQETAKSMRPYSEEKRSREEILRRDHLNHHPHRQITHRPRVLCNKPLRMIVDLRGSIGGSLGFVHLASYFCPGQLAIGHSLTPRRLRSGYDPAKLPRVPMPRSRAELLLTLARFSIHDKSLMLLTQGLGAQPFHGRIVLLINEWTNSAAEMVANFAAENRLATLVGRKTRGNVLGATNFKVGGGYWLRLPVFGWFTSQGRSLEGTGVDPDIPVDISPAELATGKDDQVARAFEAVSAL